MMTVDELREKIMGLRPNNFMAMNGAAAGILGSTDSGSDAIRQLQRAMIDFTDAYKSGGDILAAKREVIGKIMVAVAFDALSEKQADELTDALVQLTKGTK
jgi:hypothetical protein